MVILNRYEMILCDTDIDEPPMRVQMPSVSNRGAIAARGAVRSLKNIGKTLRNQQKSYIHPLSKRRDVSTDGIFSGNPGSH